VFLRQAPEGGFNGRANKLVDGCYSFWQLGGIAAADANHLEHFDHFRLQRYILATCQFASGGLLDKVGKSPDLYHTCYVLSGLRLSRLCCESHCTQASVEALLNVSCRELSAERCVQQQFMPATFDDPNFAHIIYSGLQKSKKCRDYSSMVTISGVKN
jgi:prenyltransferase beta subunit